MAKYTYVTADLLTGTVKEEIPFEGVTYGKILGAPGAFNATLAPQHPKATRANLDPGRTALYVLRDGGGLASGQPSTCVWGGIIWTAKKDDGPTAPLQIGAEGFTSYFRRRRVRATLSFAQIDQYDIGRSLINYAQAVTNGNIGVLAPTGSSASGILRDRTYNYYDRQIVGDLLDQLAACDQGFDYSIEVAFDGTNFTKTFVPYYPSKGTRTGLTWEVGVHCDLNGWAIDATTAANVMDSLGGGQAESMLITTAQDPNTAYPVLEDTRSYSDVSDPVVLSTHAVADLAATRLPSCTPGVTLRPTPDTQIGGFVEGDQISLIGNEGFIALDGLYRLMEYDVTVSEEGDEATKIIFQDAQVAY